MSNKIQRKIIGTTTKPTRTKRKITVAKSFFVPSHPQILQERIKDIAKIMLLRNISSNIYLIIYLAQPCIKTRLKHLF